MKTRFPYIMWHYCCIGESLFDLPTDALQWFKLLCAYETIHHKEPA